MKSSFFKLKLLFIKFSFEKKQENKKEKPSIFPHKKKLFILWRRILRRKMLKMCFIFFSNMENLLWKLLLGSGIEIGGASRSLYFSNIHSPCFVIMFRQKSLFFINFVSSAHKFKFQKNRKISNNIPLVWKLCSSTKGSIIVSNFVFPSLLSNGSKNLKHRGIETKG